MTAAIVAAADRQQQIAEAVDGTSTGGDIVWLRDSLDDEGQEIVLCLTPVSISYDVLQRLHSCVDE